jgi:(1->4)-alpha-D-glucan 1-alpha-D-glucosylmutase
LLLKITSPGLPDFYQGSELWDLNFSDPDNRRPVDFEARRHLLAQLHSHSHPDRASLFCGLLQNWHEGAIKLLLLTTLLRFRRDNYLLFETGAYEPLLAENSADLRVCSYFRTAGDQSCLILASLDARLHSPDFHGVRIPLGSHAVPTWRDVITETIIASPDGALDLSKVFATLPVALLIPA